MGRGEFSILDGGAVNVLNGAEFGVAMTRGPLKVVVSGPGSTWSIRDEWNMVDTPHEIVVENGGKAVIGLRAHFSGPLGGPRGSATIRGAQTRWESFGFAPTRTNVLISDGASLTARYAAIDRTTLSIRDGADVSVSDFVDVAGDSRSDLIVSGPGSTLTVPNNLGFRFGDTHLTIENGGMVTSKTGSIDRNPQVRKLSSATITGAGSTWTMAETLNISEADLFVRDGGKVQLGGDFAAATSAHIVLSDGQIQANRVRTDGEIVGNGVFVADVEARNKVTVGNSAGLLTVQGDYIHSSSASLAMELAGPGSVAGVDFDQLVVRDLARLVGPINVALINNYTPAKGDSFDLIRYGSVQFDSRTGPPPLNLPSLTGDLFWSSNFGPQSLTITVVPEPSGFVFMITCVVGFYIALRRFAAAAETIRSA